MVTAQAQGKLFLLGEHAVVYGYPAIIAALNTKLSVTVSFNKKEIDEFVTSGSADTRFISAALSYFKKKFDVPQSICVTTKSDFTDKVGFGSSSAVVVATLASLNKLCKANATIDEIYEMSFDVVRDVQGVLSGADIAASTYGGVLYFQRKELPVIKKITYPDFVLTVGYSGAKADTVTMVAKVAKKLTQEKEMITNLFEMCESLVEKGFVYLQQKKYEEFGECMSAYHTILQKLNVSTNKLDVMVEAAQDSGAWGAKLSGAGGGDCMIAISSEAKKNEVEKAISKAGGTIIPITISQNGVSII